MIQCALCGEDLGDKDAYIRGSISGEVIDLTQKSPKPTGQKNAWDGVAFCLQHFVDIPKNIANNLGLIAKKRKLQDDS
jgi:hypothetical protein